MKLYYITAAYAQLERGILAERVRAGMGHTERDSQRAGANSPRKSPPALSAAVGPRESWA